MRIHYLDGSRLYNAFLAGGEAVIRDYAYLNKINVFPVPDADTGTNLASTIRAISQGARAHRSIRETFRSLADAALSGARGNSGLIFAQFLHGMSQEVGSEPKITTRAFAESVRRAAAHARRAVARPVEGTMLTVIRDWAEDVYEKRHVADFAELFSQSLAAARESLRRTPLRLQVLAKAGVVDAGAKGFVDFLEGVLHFIARGRIRRAASIPDEPWTVESAKTPPADARLEFRFCAEALLAGSAIDVEAVREAVGAFGDSAVVAGSRERARVHVHTNDPAGLFALLAGRATIAQLKIDDMKRQYEAAHARRSEVAFVTDSACDLPAALVEERQIHVIPFTLSFGGQQFLDKLSITPARFYERLASSRVHPKTAQPDARTVENRLGYLASHYGSVIAVTISDKLTGMHGLCRRAAEGLPGRRISVFDSRSISAAQGLLVARASEMAAAGAGHGEIAAALESWIPRTKLLVDVSTLKSLVRGGRVSRTKGLLARLLNVKPIITLDAEGRSAEAGKSFSRRGNMARILRLVEAEARRSRFWGYAVVHARDAERAAEYAAKLTAILGRPPAWIEEVAPVIGAHAGVGAVGIAWLSE